jgi:uncharacterized protein
LQAEAAGHYPCPMATLMERVAADLTAAMKAKDQARVDALRMAKSALKNKEIDKRSALDDSEAAKVLQGLVKQREDSIEQFTKAGRMELVQKEEGELALLRAYLPAEASDADIADAVAKAVAETGATSQKDMGKVMKAAMAVLQAAGKPADGKKLSEAVRAKLQG